jgi:subtilisin family serine protease
MSALLRFIALALLATPILTAEAQVRLPEINTPQLPAVTQTVDGTLGTGRAALDSVDLRKLRRTQVRDLLRRNRDVLERDPNGNPAVRRELLGFAPSAQALQQAQAAGFSIVREERSDELGTHIVVLLAPEGMSTARSLRRLQEIDPEGTYDYNHVYTGSGLASEANGSVTDTIPPPSIIQVNAVRVGLIDGGVLQSHPVFGTTRFHLQGCNGLALPNSHGTAVASLIAMQTATRALDLYVADVYCNEPTGGTVTAIAAAFVWMTRERVPVVNVSLVGPPNRMLERMVDALLRRGHVIVAAVGNDGPNAKPLYPAAYPGVVGVTGVDRRNRVLPEALRGPQVDFAAAGADFTGATMDSKYGPLRGTSFAAPIVAALIAADRSEIVPDASTQALDKFSKLARDLGKPGFDPIYGFGLLASAVGVQAQRRE